MMIAFAISFTLTTASGPLDAALDATEAPKTLRLAFDVEIESGNARRVYRYDPRYPETDRWHLIAREGDNRDLDEVGDLWGLEPSPDARLFPDDLRASLGGSVEVEDLGAAWRVAFRHAPSTNDTAFDVWAAERLTASAWIDPAANRFLRIDYTLPKPIRGPDGGRLTRFDQSWFLETEPTYGLSLVTAFTIDFEGRAGPRRIRRSYRARVLRLEAFFASPDAKAEFEMVRAESSDTVPGEEVTTALMPQ